MIPEKTSRELLRDFLKSLCRKNSIEWESLNTANVTFTWTGTLPEGMKITIDITPLPLAPPLCESCED